MPDLRIKHSLSLSRLSGRACCQTAQPSNHPAEALLRIRLSATYRTRPLNALAAVLKGTICKGGAWWLYVSLHLNQNLDIDA
jgi:hypothetical protein